MLHGATTSSLSPSSHPTSSPPNLLISPFLLSSRHLTPHHPPSPSRRPATWLHLPVLVRTLPSHSSALRTAAFMSGLRHPNLEQLLGLVTTGPHAPCALTERVHGLSLAHALRRSARTLPRGAPRRARVALDVTRALVYMHATTCRAHGGVDARAVVLDLVRGRAVLLVPAIDERESAATVATAATAAQGQAADVYAVGALIVQLYSTGEGGREGEKRVGAVPDGLRGTVERCLRAEAERRPGIEEVCASLERAVERW